MCYTGVIEAKGTCVGDWVPGEGVVMMSYLSSTAPRHDEEENSRGGPIAGLVVAIPISLMLWGVVMFVLFNLLK